jgi:hypothetical protein
MSVLKKSLYTLLITATAAQPVLADYQGPMQADPRPNAEIYSKYCTGNPDSTEIPSPIYSNELVQAATQRLNVVAPLSFYFYSGIKRAYQLVKADGSYVDAPADAPKGTTPEAHAFLVQLCGEFRDRASMIEAKLRWTTKLNKMPAQKQQAFDPKQNPWTQMTAESYSPYISFSRQLFDARQELTSSKPYTMAGESRYIFSEFVSKKAKFPGLDKYNKGLEPFAQAHCSIDDRNDYYDFRGDSNFKPNSPEANGMIWYAKTISGQCKNPSEAKADAKITSEDCQRYFRAPFKARWNAARAGLAAWLWRDRSLDPTFASTHSLVTIIPHLESTIRPFDFEAGGVTSKFESSLSPGDFQSPDLGLNKLTAGNPDLMYSLLRDAVNRHTDWYASGYKDGVGIDATQAYSPFVASSYEMSASDGFTMPGVTVNSPSDGHKHWMFVFRIKGKNWYNSKSVKDGRAVDFDTDWFDETSLGNNGLADSERAWDRLGTALEGDLDSILYLHNLDTGGSVKSDGLAQIGFPGGPYTPPTPVTPPTVTPPTVTPPTVTPPVVGPQPGVKKVHELKLDRASFGAQDPAETAQVFYRGKVHRRLRDSGIENEISAAETKIRVEYIKTYVTVFNGETESQLLDALAQHGIKEAQ